MASVAAALQSSKQCGMFVQNTGNTLEYIWRQKIIYVTRMCGGEAYLQSYGIVSTIWGERCMTSFYRLRQVADFTPKNIYRSTQRQVRTVEEENKMKTLQFILLAGLSLFVTNTMAADVASLCPQDKQVPCQSA